MKNGVWVRKSVVDANELLIRYAMLNDCETKLCRFQNGKEELMLLLPRDLVIPKNTFSSSASSEALRRGLTLQ